MNVRVVGGEIFFRHLGGEFFPVVITDGVERTSFRGVESDFVTGGLKNTDSGRGVGTGGLGFRFFAAGKDQGTADEEDGTHRFHGAKCSEFLA